MSFIQRSTAQFQQYKALAEKAMAQLPNETLLRDLPDADANSIVVIIKHMHGNMLSRWTAFLTEDGEKPWRAREEEFGHEAISREALLSVWNEGWDCVLATMRSLTDAELTRTIHIRTEPMTAMDGIIRQLTHYAYHVGQIVLLCKQQKGDGWQSLSIPRGGTAAFNAAFAAQIAGAKS